MLTKTPCRTDVKTIMPKTAKPRFQPTWAISLFGFVFLLTLFRPEKIFVQGTRKPLTVQGDTSVLFIENAGQYGEGALFQSEWEGGTLFLAQDALWLSYLDAT